MDVVDPRHPLYGKRFKVTLIPFRTRDPQFIFVEFVEGMQIRLPFQATNLCSIPLPRVYSRLSRSSLEELTTLLQEFGQPCLKDTNPISGKVSRTARKKKSGTK